LQRPFTPEDYLKNKRYYERSLWEAKFQRNAIVHSSRANDKALITLNESLTKILRRLRVILFNGIREKLAPTYPEIVQALKTRGALLTEPSECELARTKSEGV
jgi:FMN phosphatase YigB (HAD superfamily)